ncbi:DUF5810 domain-containing protein [Halorubrum sp. HHNYT27]|uniref:DUF5810 domain-containing protein n=1 Tax=Halorubrum sp. HHNYT27 TaxID=3402275 RepID=UPI003EB8411E
MGYACPVCETPQRDGEHLAHHLAFTAMLHGDDHETWLDDRVPDWSDRDPDGLAAEVTPHAEAAEYHEVFEDTVDRGRPNVDLGEHDHAGHAQGGHAGHDHAEDRGAANAAPPVDESGATDAETAAALREARELTRELLSEGDEDGETGGADSDDGDGDGDDPVDDSSA